MDNIKKEFIREIMETLKIQGAFNAGTIADEIQHIPSSNLREFHKALFGTSHSYLNGMDRIIKVAEQFKPVIVDEVTDKAKELIELVHSMNNQIFQDAKSHGVPFEDLLAIVKFPNVSEEDMAILNNVKPYQELKTLITKVSCYNTSLEQLTAFKNAIEYTQSYSGAIENMNVKKMIGSMK